jgi:hypothetical protein
MKTIGLFLSLLMVLAGLPTTHAGPGPDPALLLTPAPTAVATGTPRIVLFRATPDTLVAGESFLLEWRSVNATRALLFTDDLPHQGPVPPTGSIGFEDVPAGTYGLRLVVLNDADPPQSDQRTLVVHVAEPAGVLIVDDVDAQFVRHGNPAFWFEADVGYGNHMIWTYVNGDAVSNWIEWRPDLPACGVYAVSAFIPSQNATTQEARYEVYHTHGSGIMPADESPRVIVVNQSAYSDEWVPLGTYRFERSQDSYVRLTDATGEDPNSLRKIGFDAVRWQLENRCASRIFLPLIQR